MWGICKKLHFLKQYFIFCITLRLSWITFLRWWGLRSWPKKFDPSVIEVVIQQLQNLLTFVRKLEAKHGLSYKNFAVKLFILVRWVRVTKKHKSTDIAVSAIPYRLYVNTVLSSSPWARTENRSVAVSVCSSACLYNLVIWLQALFVSLPFLPLRGKAAASFSCFRLP